MTLRAPLTRKVIAAVAAALALAGCVASPPQAAPLLKGPAVTLWLAVYGYSGYQQAGLPRGYERPHPGTRIVVDEADVATAFDTFAMLFPNATPLSGF